jgi:trehalose/maltose hydrolase-like predicted phosphorylase
MQAYKQASTLLAVYPLQYPPAEAQAKTLLGRFAGKVTSDVPAMSSCIDAIVADRAGDPAGAYKYWLKSWQPFTKTPLLLFSEKPRFITTYFTTGAAGALQAVLYGFCGFRIDSEPSPGSTWSQRLLGGSVLSVKPNLPTAWRSVSVKNFTVRGRHFTLTATQSSCHVTQGD